MQGAVAGGGEVTSRRSRSPLGDPLVLLLAAAMLASGAVLLYLTRNFNFLLDEWTFLLGRRGLNADALLAPHNEHLSLIPVLIYKSLLEVFGMESARPFQVVAIATFLTSAAVLFAWLRTRIDGWLALGATVLVLFMGAAWEDLLWAFQVGYFGSMAAGLGMLLALRRESRGGDRVACALLVVSICCSSLGIPFVAGALVAIATGAALAIAGLRRRRAGRALRPLVAGLGTRGLQDHLAREPRRRAAVRVRLDRVGDLLAARPGDAARRVRGRRLRLGPGAGGGGDRARRLASGAAGLGAALALGRRGDRVLVLAALGVQPDPRSSAELEPVPVRRRDLRDPDRGRAPARRPAAAGGARGRRGGRAAGRAQRDLAI